MYLLYLDHSGEKTDPNQKHFTLAGISVFERQTYWLSQQMERIASRFNPTDPNSIELHANPMITGNKGWKEYKQQDRQQAVVDVLKAIARSHDSTVLFGVCKDKRVATSHDIVSEVFESVCVRFDFHLKHLHQTGKETQKGLFIFDKADYEKELQKLAIYFKHYGHSWGVTRNIAEVPLFLDSQASRLIQAADIIAWSINRKFERGDASYFDIIKHRFANANPIHRGFEYYSYAPSREPQPELPLVSNAG